jgi:hypothetical protein
MEQMSVLLDLARRAERAAKAAGRDRLTIIFDKRSGGERSVTLTWSKRPVEQLRRDAALLKETLSTGKVYEVDALRRRFRDIAPERRVHAAAALGAYAGEALRHTGEGKAVSLAKIGLDPQPGENFEADLGAAIDRLLVVRSLRKAGFA